MELINDFLGKDMYDLKILQYKPLKLLGEGSFSKVYLAEKFETKELRSIKIIDIARRQEKDISILSNEINNLKYLDHPNIIKLDDHFRTQNRLYLVFYYINGMTLSDLIKTIRPDQYFDIVKQLCYTVHYIHKNNIIHRDIKPQNILITSTQYGLQPILMDFGLSTKITRDQRYIKGQYGTPFYMAPEIHQNYAQDFKIDIWALGICFYNMVNNGLHPFCNDEDNLACVKVKMILAEFKREWPKIDKNLKDLILQCLYNCASSRISSEQLLCHPFLLVQEIGNYPKAQGRRSLKVRFSVDNFQRKEQEKSVEKPQHRQQTPQQALKIKTEEDSPLTKRPINKKKAVEEQLIPQQSATPKQFRINASPIKIKTEASQSPNRINSQLNHRKISIAGQPSQSPLGQKIQSPIRVQGNIFTPIRRNSPSISQQILNSPQLQNQSPTMPRINKLPPKAPLKIQVIK